MKPGLREVRLIHGRGKGVQRGIVQQALETPSARRGVLGRNGDASGRHGRASSRLIRGRRAEPRRIRTIEPLTIAQVLQREHPPLHTATAGQAEIRGFAEA